MSGYDPMDHCMPGIRDLRPYEPGKPISEIQREYGVSDVVKLASNENPLGASPKAVDAMRAQLDEVALYPDGNGFALKAALAEKHGIGADRITLSSGSDHVFELAARVFLGPGRKAVMSRYGFAIFAIAAKSVSADVVMADALPPDHPRMPYGHDVDALLAAVDADTRIVYVANPNNPTGTRLSTDELSRLLEGVGEDVLVMVDEAYAEYVDEADHPDASTWLDRYPNLVVMRTFSKAYGLAGVRVGYALASAAVTDLLNRVRLSFNPNLLAQTAAVAALGDAEHIERTVALNRSEMARMEAFYDELGLARIPSVCNFITVDTGRDGGEVFEALLREGVITRPLKPYGLTTHLRISIGKPEENDRVMAALRKVLGR